MSRLSIYRDETLVSEVVLMRASVSLGRHPDNDVVLDDRTLSRFHARVERRGDSYFVVDLNAQNGIYLNGSRITGATGLAAGDRIVFGKYVAIYDADATAPSKRRGSGGHAIDVAADSAEDPPTPDRGIKTDIINPRAILRGAADRLGEDILLDGDDQPEHTRTEVGVNREPTVEVLGHVSEALHVSDDPTTKLVPKSFKKNEPTVALLFNGNEVSRHSIGNGVVIGRSKGCDVVISLLGLSRRHTRLEKRGNDVFVIDLESQNGTWVNNTRVDRERRLAHGDILNFYEYGVVYLEDAHAQVSSAASTFTPPVDATQDVLARQETGHRGPQTLPAKTSARDTERDLPPPRRHEPLSEERAPRSQPLDDLGLGDGAHFPDDESFDDGSSDLADEPALAEPAGGGTAISDDLGASLISSDLDDDLIAELDEFTSDPTTASRVPGRSPPGPAQPAAKHRSWVTAEDLEAALVRRVDKRVRRLEVYLDDQLYTQVPLTQQVTRIGTDARCELALPSKAGLTAWQLTIITFPAATLLYRASANARVRIDDDDIDHVLLKDGDIISLGRVRIQFHVR
jgi:pSer/pThr/pTyr-binding forkhead associated (FHA) protein